MAYDAPDGNVHTYRETLSPELNGRQYLTQYPRLSHGLLSGVSSTVLPDCMAYILLLMDVTGGVMSVDKKLFYQYVSWCVWYDGLRLYDNDVPGHIHGVNVLRAGCLRLQQHNGTAQKLISDATDNELADVLNLIGVRLENGKYPTLSLFFKQAYVVALMPIQSGSCDRRLEQNFRDEKSERFGFALRASYSRTEGRILVLSLLATLSTIVLWLLGYYAEIKGLHLRYQANSIKSRRVISFLTLAENVLRHSPLILRRISLSEVLVHLTRVYRNMVLVY